MKDRQLYIAESDTGTPGAKLDENESFTENFQTAILLSLLDKGTLTKWQFDICVDKLQEQHR